VKRPLLILASQSEARQRLLKRMGRSFRAIPAEVDEESYKKRITDPRKLARVLARAKAEAVALKYERSVVIGSDQLVVFNGKVFGKPGSERKAIEQLRRFSGKSIQLLTAVCVLDQNSQRFEFVDKTEMRFRKLTADEIKTYVRADRPFECAGSFKFEQRGITLFDSIKSNDPSAIEGLPALRLETILRFIY